MNSLQKAIISTLAFYDSIGGMPLTRIELYKRLIGQTCAMPLSFCDFYKQTESNWEELSQYISYYRGFYFLKKNPKAYERRINTGKTAIKKWRIARRMAKIISFLPYVRMIALTGSLALDNTSAKSDIDVLIVAKTGAIWTTRMLISALTHALGQRRHGRKIADRICLNHYIAETSLELRPKHLFSAHICTSLIPIWDIGPTAQALMSRNKKIIKSFFPHICKTRSSLPNLREVKKDPRVLYDISAIFEIILSHIAGKQLERLMKAMQVRKIKKNIARGLVQQREIIFDDQALVFHHPRSREQEALYLYEHNLEQLGLKT